MQQPQGAPPSAGSNRLGAGCLILFSLPFTLCGGFVIFQALRQPWKMPESLLLAGFGSVFLLAGLGISAAGWFGSKSAAAEAARKQQFPDQPWMWRDDWAAGHIKEYGGAQTIAIWVFAIIWNAISWPVAMIIRPEIEKGNKVVLFALLFPLVGIFLFIAAIRQTIQRMKFGKSICHIDSIPIKPGHRFRGELELRTDLSPQSGYRFQLTNIRAVTSGSGKNRSTHESTLWEDERIVDPSGAMRSPVGTRVPFELIVPPDAQTTDATDSNDRYYWRLSASADLPGVDYEATFELPVFSTGEPVDVHEFAAYQQSHRVEAAHHELPQDCGVVATPLATGGEEFRLAAKKTFSGVLGSLFFLGAWNAAIWAMIHFHVPWGIPAVFGALDLIFIFGTIDYLFGRSTIEADRAGIRVRRTRLGFGSTRTFEEPRIESIDVLGQSGGGGTFTVTLKLKDGGKPFIANYLTTRGTADVLAAKMWTALGKRAEESVEQESVEE
jgi:hypothetical protein